MELLPALIIAISFIILLFLGMPIAFTIGISTVLAMIMMIPPQPALTTAAQRIATSLDSFALLAIPFFILSGQLMNRGGIAKRLIDFSRVMVGRLPGGLFYVNIIACMLFGAISGSAIAATAAIGGFMIPLMVREKYDRNMCAAVNITSSTSGLLIPPSNVMIVYSLASGGASITALFLAGYLPGLMLGLTLMAASGLYAYRHGYPADEIFSLKEKFILFLRAVPSLILIFIVIGGIVAGYFTATEASAIAVFYTFILSVFIYRQIKFREIGKIFLEAAVTTSVVMLLIGVSVAMSWIMSYARIPQTLSSAMLSVTDSKILILLIMNMILLLVGTFMDITPAILVFTPIFLPIARSLGIHPVHFGMIMIFNLCIGLCTPPVGSILFVGSGIAKTPIVKILRPLLPLFILMIINLLIITFIPEISLFLPRIFGFE